MLEKTLESPLDCKEIQPVSPKGNQSWIFIGRTDADAETPILWPPDAKNWLIGKDSDAVKDWRQDEKRMTEDSMVWWHHRVDGHEFEQALRIGDGQGSLACCSPWGCKESDTTEWLNWLKTKVSLGHFENLCFYTWVGNNPAILRFKPMILLPSQFSSVMSECLQSHVLQCQASLSITNSQSLLKFMSIELAIPFNHLIFCRPLLLLPSIFPRVKAFLMTQLFAWGGQSIVASASAAGLPRNIQDWFPLGLTGLISFDLQLWYISLLPL